MKFRVLLFALTASSAVASLRGEKEQESPCHAAKDQNACFAKTDEDGFACQWCECKAIPSECLSQAESKNVPAGVFDCSSPSISSKEDKFANYKDRIQLFSEPVPDDLCDVNSKSGYMSVEGSEYDKDGENKNLFYWQFDKRNGDETDESIPFVVWLTGGPGCSSSLALLTENGPCKVKKGGKETELNPYSWTEAAHVLWLDQPAGVGYSFGKEDDTNEAMISEDAYWFLQKYFEAYPQYSKNPLVVVGESYGGHYAPAIAHRIWRGNQKIVDGAMELNLAGVAIGNGLTDPEEQYKWYAEMAYNNSHGIKVISKDTYDAMTSVIPKCTALISECNKGDSAINTFACQSAFLVCNLGLTSPYQATGLNPYDIRKQCGDNPLCYDFSDIVRFMNNKSTREALHISKKSHKWEACNMGINLEFHVDWMKDFSHYIADLLETGIPALIYAGDVDFICNYLGNKAWTEKLVWKGGDNFRAAKEHDWKGHGLARTFGGLTFLQVYDAGHMVPSDQPEVALDMIDTFLKGESF